MRSFLPRGTLIVGAVLLGTVLSPGGAAARRPVVAPGQQTPPKPPPPPPSAPAAEASEEPEASAPEASEGAEQEAGASADRAGKVPAGEAQAEPEKPAEPLDFNDAGMLSKPAAAEVEKAPIGPHRELRHTRRVGDFVYEMRVRPGEPQAGEPVELFFRINELLAIPDPILGDRKPLEGGKLQVRVKGNGIDRTYRIHELGDAGTYGAHFSAAGNGVYQVEVERTDLRRPQRSTFQVGDGVPTPGLAAEGDEATPRPRSRGGVDEGVRLVGVAGPNQSRISGVMQELGRRWMELERHAGTPEAAAAAAEVREQAAKIAGMMPQVAGGNAEEFDRLAGSLVDRVAGLEGHAGDRGALLDAMLQTQDQLCMRCHAKYRFEFADSVASWPDFSEKQDLQPPAASTGKSGARTRTPFGAK